MKKGNATGDSPYLKDWGVHVICEKDLDYLVFDQVTVQIVNIQKGGHKTGFRLRILSG